MSINDSQTPPTILIPDATTAALWVYIKLKEEQYPEKNIISVDDHRLLQDLVREIADKTYDVVLAPMPLDQGVDRYPLKTSEAIIDYVRNKLKITAPIVIVAEGIGKTVYISESKCLIGNKKGNYSAMILEVMTKQKPRFQALKTLATLFTWLLPLRKR